MFGETVDYWLLRPFVHDRNKATEERLDALAAAPEALSLEKAMARLEKIRLRTDGNFPVNESLHYLDVGCGKGDIAITLAKSGCKNVTGIDIVERNITAARVHARDMCVEDSTEFVCANINTWKPANRFDVILSHDALEHILDPGMFLRRLSDFVTPDGIAVLSFGPLFYSPAGDHMKDFFRVPVPWRGALFSEKAILRLRREFFRPTDPAERFEDIVENLNKMRYSEFLRYVEESGWDFDFLAVNQRLNELPLPLKLMYPVSRALVSMPWVRDCFASGVCAILRSKPRVME